MTFKNSKEAQNEILKMPPSLNKDRLVEVLIKIQMTNTFALSFNGCASHLRMSVSEMLELHAKLQRCLLNTIFLEFNIVTHPETFKNSTYMSKHQQMVVGINDAAKAFDKSYKTVLGYVGTNYGYLPNFDWNAYAGVNPQSSQSNTTQKRQPSTNPQPASTSQSNWSDVKWRNWEVDEELEALKKKMGK
jgi:hypothetical protein